MEEIEEMDQNQAVNPQETAQTHHQKPKKKKTSKFKKKFKKIGLNIDLDLLEEEDAQAR